MSQGNFILREPEYESLLSILRKLLTDASAKVVFLVDKNGTLLASAGDAAGFDTTSLASLAAGNIAATGGLANLIGEKEFSILFHEGERDNMHLSVIENRLILVVIFGRNPVLLFVGIGCLEWLTMAARANDRITTRGLSVRRLMLVNNENATAEWPLGMPPWSGVPLP